MKQENMHSLFLPLPVFRLVRTKVLGFGCKWLACQYVCTVFVVV